MPRKRSTTRKKKPAKPRGRKSAAKKGGRKSTKSKSPKNQHKKAETVVDGTKRMVKGAPVKHREIAVDAVTKGYRGVPDMPVEKRKVTDVVRREVPAEPIPVVKPTDLDPPPEKRQIDNIKRREIPP